MNNNCFFAFLSKMARQPSLPTFKTEDDGKKKKKKLSRGLLGRGVMVDFFAFIMVVFL